MSDSSVNGSVITLYDIPSTIGSWSPNVWKVRFALNVKSIPHKTIWVEMSDIESVAQSLGASPPHLKTWSKTNPSAPLYTLPIIHDPNTNAVISDSLPIAEYLDETYPDTPTLVPKGTRALIAGFNFGFMSAVVLDWLYPFMIPALVGVMNPASADYFRSTREMVFGRRLCEISPVGSELREEQWRKVREGFRLMNSWFEPNGVVGGEYVMGDKTFADLVLVGWLILVKIVQGEDSREWKDVKSWDGGRWGRLIEAYKKYEIVF
ncbi:hypothetical protein JAAARDRAFT_158904 [Jaapia argillacea MUCL 33604]|uniref:GST N-terminal domain-containing protein n=1 Tax=Jaapia argillacea MUCL 33604 TaxID=933084 RepID=A0A067PWA4_9AGAM|nr:hypothetical protein JAAARDRAFT_158904 [Jaapia argillacea MUCL 33604]